MAQNAEGVDPSKVINPANRDTSGSEQIQDNAQTITQGQGAGDGTGDGTDEGTGDGTDGGEPIRALW